MTNKLLFFFIDGVGLSNTIKNNPLTQLFKEFTHKEFLLENYPIKTDNLLLKPIDPVMDVLGIPQSATGQTSIMTGINSQKHLGFHHTAFPNKELIELIKDFNLLKELNDLKIKTTCANMYSKEFFEKRSKRKKNMFPVSALSIKHANLPFRFLNDYNNGEAVFADITNELIRKRGYDIEIISPETAASNILNIFQKNDFIFFEYFITDTFGHKREEKKLKYEVEKINKFINKIWSNGDNGVDIIVTSDHGNSEDISTGNHTLNPVPLLCFSRNREKIDFLDKHVKDLTGIKSGMISLLTEF